MGFSKNKKNNTDETKKIKKDKIKKYTINLNNKSFTKENFRFIQLTALFHYIKLELNAISFNEIETQKYRYYIPYSFTLNETIAIVQNNLTKMLYIEIDENNYIEINFDTINIHGEQYLYDIVNKLLPLAESYKFAPKTFYYKFNGADWLWNNYLKKQFFNIMLIGNRLFGNGYILIHPLEDDEYEAITFTDYKKAENNIEYIAIRSNYEEDKVLIINNETKEFFGSGFDELETSELLSLIKT